MQDGMTIGRLAKAAGVNVETIRYYQRRALVDEPSRPPGGQRRYPRAVLGRLSFIRRAQQLGFSLEEVKSLIELADGSRPRESCLIAERKHESLMRRIAELDRMCGELARLIAASRKSRRKSCPIIAALLQPE